MKDQNKDKNQNPQDKIYQIIVEIAIKPELQDLYDEDCLPEFLKDKIEDSGDLEVQSIEVSEF